MVGLFGEAGLVSGLTLKVFDQASKGSVTFATAAAGILPGEKHCRS
jgi:hypothetical protein